MKQEIYWMPHIVDFGSVLKTNAMLKDVSSVERTAIVMIEIQRKELDGSINQQQNLNSIFLTTVNMQWWKMLAEQNECQTQRTNDLTSDGINLGNFQTSILFACHRCKVLAHAVFLVLLGKYDKIAANIMHLTNHDTNRSRFPIEFSNK